MDRKVRVRIAALLAAAGLVVGACGGSGKKPVSSATTVTSAGVGQSATTSPTAGVSSESTTTTISAVSGAVTTSTAKKATVTTSRKVVTGAASGGGSAQVKGGIANVTAPSTTAP